MGGLFSYLLSWGTPSAPQYDTTPDPTTGLSEKDRKIIQETWALAADKKTVKKNSVDFFILLFEMYPYIQDYFIDFKKKPVSDLRQSAKLRAHATSVFYAITSYAEMVDDPETLVGLVKKIAVSHLARGITVKEFENLQAAFLAFLKKLLGDQCTPDIVSAWDKLLSAQCAVYKMTADELANHK